MNESSEQQNGRSEHSQNEAENAAELRALEVFQRESAARHFATGADAQNEGRNGTAESPDVAPEKYECTYRYSWKSILTFEYCSVFYHLFIINHKSENSYFVSNENWQI